MAHFSTSVFAAVVCAVLVSMNTVTARRPPPPVGLECNNIVPPCSLVRCDNFNEVPTETTGPDGCPACICCVRNPCAYVRCPYATVVPPAGPGKCSTCECRAEKIGSCPRSRLHKRGTCDVRCYSDNDCPGPQKCCGGCPRKCTDPAPYY